MSWEQADDGDKILFKVLSLLYEHNENLLHMLLNPDTPRLINPELSSKERCHGLSTGEQLLMRIGLDIWDGSGGIHFNELYQHLDYCRFQKVILALNYLYSPGEAALF